jgi:hypothetical protein
MIFKNECLFNSYKDLNCLVFVIPQLGAFGKNLVSLQSKHHLNTN